MTTIIWAGIAAITAVALFWGINNKNNNTKNHGVNDNFVVRD